MSDSQGADMNSTYHYDCQACGSHDELSAAGGYLSCACENPCGEKLLVTRYTDDAQDWRKTMSAIVGRSSWDAGKNCGCCRE